MDLKMLAVTDKKYRVIPKRILIYYFFPRLLPISNLLEKLDIIV